MLNLLAKKVIISFKLSSAKVRQFVWGFFCSICLLNRKTIPLRTFEPLCLFLFLFVCLFVCFFFSFSLSGLTWEKYSSSDFGAFQFKDVLDFIA